MIYVFAFPLCVVLYLAFLLNQRRSRSIPLMALFFVAMVSTGLALEPSTKDAHEWLNYWLNALVWSGIGGSCYHNRKWVD